MTARSRSAFLFDMDNNTSVAPEGPTIYSACISMAQYKQGVRVSAHINAEDSQSSISVAVEWADLPRLNAGGCVPLWVYGALSQLLQNFDDHTVLKAEVEPAVLLKESTNG